MVDGGNFTKVVGVVKKVVKPIKHDQQNNNVNRNQTIQSTPELKQNFNASKHLGNKVNLLH